MKYSGPHRRGWPPPSGARAMDMAGARTSERLHGGGLVAAAKSSPPHPPAPRAASSACAPRARSRHATAARNRIQRQSAAPGKRFATAPVAAMPPIAACRLQLRCARLVSTESCACRSNLTSTSLNESYAIITFPLRTKKKPWTGPPLPRKAMAAKDALHRPSSVAPTPAPAPQRLTPPCAVVD